MFASKHAYMLICLPDGMLATAWIGSEKGKGVGNRSVPHKNKSVLKTLPGQERGESPKTWDQSSIRGKSRQRQTGRIN
jgi:hypothetical protein